MKMNKVYNIGGIACRVEYHPDFDETFFHPAQDEKWAPGVFNYLAQIVEQNGYILTGGHEYYLPVAGNVFTGQPVAAP